MSRNRQIVLASRPKGRVTEENFRLIESPTPEPGEGQVLVKNHWLSLDPYMRGRMDEAKSCAKSVELGEVMVGSTVKAGSLGKSRLQAPGPAQGGKRRWTAGIRNGRIRAVRVARIFPTEDIMPRTLLFALTILGLALSAPSWSQNIKIAILGPMAFVQGENHWAGAEMARDEINQAGGISVGGKKRQVEIIKVDTNEIQSVPDATNAIERAIARDRADFLVGGFRTEAVLAMQEVAMDNKKLFLGAGAAHSKLGLNVEQNYDRYKYWFRITPPKDVDLGREVFAAMGSIAAQMRNDLKKPQPKVAIVAEKAAWVEALLKAAQDNLPKMKMEVVGVWQPSATATDVTAELSAIKRADADIVFTILSGPVGIVMGRQMGELQLPAIAFGINVEAQKDGFWQATNGKGQYVSTLDTYSKVDITPKTVPFVKAFQQRYKKSPTYNAATYDALLLLKDAIEKAGTPEADKLVPVLEKTVHTGTAGVLEFDKRHDPVWGPGRVTGIAVQWQNGEKVPFWPDGWQGVSYKGMKPFILPKSR